jgi:hypothetical protein
MTVYTTSFGRLLFVVPIALAAALAGCGDDGAECSAPSDCLVDEICQAGECIPTCEDSTDCTRDRACQDGVCVERARCTENDDCQSGFVCEYRLCVEQSAECSRDSDCPPNFTCYEGGCYPPLPSDAGDAGGDTDTDVSLEDAGVDTEIDVPVDTVDESDPDITTDDVAPECTRGSDCTFPEVCLAGQCVIEGEVDAGGGDGGVCEGTGDREFGELCDRSADCCTNLCVGRFDEDYGVCTQPCTSYASCNPGGEFLSEMFCSRTRDGNLCAIATWQYPCDGAIDCSGGVCLKAAYGFPSSGCSWQCTTTADCVPGSVCGTIEVAGGSVARACVPIGGECGGLLGPEFGFAECLSGLCNIDDAIGIGYCTATCDRADPNSCPAPYTCTNPDPANPAIYACTLPE